MELNPTPMNTLTKQQLVTIQTLCSKLGIGTDQKKTIISGFTAGRSNSSRDLSREEAMELIRHLKSLDPQEESAERMRRKIIRLAHELHWHLPGTTRIDMKRVDGWCRSYGFGKKGLNSYTPSELPRLVTQFELGPYSHFLKK